MSPDRIFKLQGSDNQIFWVSTSASLSDQEYAQLKQLLNADEFLSLADEDNYTVVVPRVGTISPWSSKATDIAHNCGLYKIQRIERGHFYQGDAPAHDRMTEMTTHDIDSCEQLFAEHQAQTFDVIDVLNQGIDAISRANDQLGLALSDDEIQYLADSYTDMRRNPSDVELMMFAQANSEHCRHKIFNANWTIDNEAKPHSLFQMIKNTHRCMPDDVLSAYKDNGAVISGGSVDRFYCEPTSNAYQFQKESQHILMKVETHNHPTAIAPFPGAATGSGGEIRDEGAVGRGGKPKAGLAGYMTSNLLIPNYTQSWEKTLGKPETIASALDIMLQAPIGGASFNNEFGRPNLCGFFRTFEMPVADHWRGYHKPIMIAGGLGNIKEEHVLKNDLPDEALVIVLGGPAMKIGLGGGAASSVASGMSDAELDFASVQRSNPEMQRRVQEVIDRCWAMGTENPILSIHDVGAGGLSNAIPEIIEQSDRGGKFELRTIPNAEPGMSPLAIWCNEAQERYVLAIEFDQFELFKKIAERERCIYAVVGEVTADPQLILGDGEFDNTPIDIPLALLFGKAPKLLKQDNHHPFHKTAFDTSAINLKEAAEKILQHPTVANKSFLITIGDRSITGLVARDQMVGPWQVPVADVAVTAAGFLSETGEAMAMGERTPIAVIDHAASARMAVGEAITNIAAAQIEKISDIKLSANWMTAAKHPGEGAGLYDAVHAIGMELCPQLGIAIPVGKDSMSMRTVWDDKQVTSPLSLVITAFSPVSNIHKTLTPELDTQVESDLIFIDLGKGKQRLGGSILAQVYELIGHHAPNVDDADRLKHFFNLIQILNKNGLLFAYHDRSDGGLFTTLVEMAFASHCGLDIQLESLGEDATRILFNEELGAVIQVDRTATQAVLEHCKNIGLAKETHIIGQLNQDDHLRIYQGDRIVFDESRIHCQRLWSRTSFEMQSLRDDPKSAQQEFDAILDQADPGLNAKITFECSAPSIQTQKPNIAILREQGVNGQTEMAAAFTLAGFHAVDVHMSDILEGRVDLNQFQSLAACGGFSYGDVLGAGRGWANTILMNTRAREQFSEFFQREDTLTLGVCNGCQMLSHLKQIIPGAEHWPQFLRNASKQFEARTSLVEIQKSPSLLLENMQGSRLPIAVAHGEGRIFWEDAASQQRCQDQQLIALQYVNHYGEVSEAYPFNPNGSSNGMTGLTTDDGRVTIMMPHPERVFRTSQFSWHPKDWSDYSPWMQLFINAARAFCT